MTRAFSKLYIPSIIKTQKFLVIFYFWAEWDVRAVLQISGILLKYCTTSVFIVVLGIYSFRHFAKFKFEVP